MDLEPIIGVMGVHLKVIGKTTKSTVMVNSHGKMDVNT